jgi:hypothetical protein
LRCIDIIERDDHTWRLPITALRRRNKPGVRRWR